MDSLVIIKRLARVLDKANQTVQYLVQDIEHEIAKSKYMQERLISSDRQWAAIAEYLGGDARDVPDPYTKDMVGRVKYAMEHKDELNKSG